MPIQSAGKDEEKKGEITKMRFFFKCLIFFLHFAQFCCNFAASNNDNDNDNDNDNMTRGIRNNNPLNIRCSSAPWKGKVLSNTDGKFEQFVSMYYGFRAAIQTIETYILKHRCNTIRKIINRWAPVTENKTENYIQYVCRKTNIGGNEPLSNQDSRLRDIVEAMAEMESGVGIKDYLGSLDEAFQDFEPKRIDKQ